MLMHRISTMLRHRALSRLSSSSTKSMPRSRNTDNNLRKDKYLRIQSFHSSYKIYSPKTVPITFITPEGDEQEVQAEIGSNLLEVAHANDIYLEGACGGELACATCHLIFDQEVYDSLPEKVDEEDDMLDLAFNLTETSRLGCQICVKEECANIKVTMPEDDY